MNVHILLIILYFVLKRQQLTDQVTLSIQLSMYVCKYVSMYEQFHHTQSQT